MLKNMPRARIVLAASLLLFAAACADAGTDDDAAGTGDNTILPSEDPTGGVGDMGTGTGTTGPGTETPDTGVGMDTSAAQGGTAP